MKHLPKPLAISALVAAMIAAPMAAHAAPVGDTTKPVVTVTSAPSVFNSGASALLVVNATDDVGLKRVTANVYSGTTLVDSNSVSAGGVTDYTYTVDLQGLPQGSYTIKINAEDTSTVSARGNIASTLTLPIVVDNTKPVITLKSGSTFVNGWTTVASFGLADNAGGQIDYVTVNGVKKDLSNNRWSDLNSVRPGQFGAVQGANTIIAYDTAGNASDAYVLYLDTTGPTATVKTGTSSVDGTAGANGVYRFVSFKLHDQANVAFISINNVVKSVTPNVWSDLNGLTVGNNGVVEGLNTLVLKDALGNQSTYTFVIDVTAPVVTGISSVWNAEKNRSETTLTFSEPVTVSTQGWYGSGTSWTRALYNTKESNVAFADLVGNPGSYAFTPVGAPPVIEFAAPAVESVPEVSDETVSEAPVEPTE